MPEEPSMQDITMKIFVDATSKEYRFRIFPEDDTDKAVAVLFRDSEVTKAVVDRTLDAIKREEDPDPNDVVKFTYGEEGTALKELLDWINSQKPKSKKRKRKAKDGKKPPATGEASSTGGSSLTQVDSSKSKPPVSKKGKERDD